ncbi:MAG: hypothetical protein PUI06_00705 [Prevotella sp.]|nr:hypothetical protein [Prevotella sp.]
MNIYARYFNQEALLHNYDELMGFLSSIPEIPITQRMEEDVKEYLDSDMPYPKRYKIRPRVYFILIKTNADTMDEFKANHKEEGELSQSGPTKPEMLAEPVYNKKDIKMVQLAEQRTGWYLGTIVFKRVIQISGTTKFRYQDTTFQAYVRATSGQECYNRIIEHLKNRSEVDLRSQFPSARGSNFTFEFVGNELPTEGEQD